MSFKSEEEIRPKNVFKELLACCEEDAAYLIANGSFEKVPCPGCGIDKPVPAFIKHGFEYVYCSNCNSLYNSPRPTQASFNAFYPVSKSSHYFFNFFYPAVEESRKIKLIPERVQRVSQFIEKEDKKKVLLDVGAGQGFFFDLMRVQFPDFEYRVIEPNNLLAETCVAKGYKTIVDFIENVNEWQKEIDFIICFEVFEHIREPENFLQQFKKLLKPGGKILITSLSGDGLDIKYLKENADIVAPPQHLNFLSVNGYRSIFSRLGFSNTEIITPGKLDVDIVINKVNDTASLQNNDLFKFIGSLNSEAKAQFQQFLANNLLSSHVWVIATL
jgi:SAM-dependent methyltransferase